MEAMDLNEARIYVGTYAKYNNGSLQGEWVCRVNQQVQNYNTFL